jgi:ectoine hydroxylase-related dioxygenase (phytanoyl-CoA dioxygenase family)
MATRLSSRASEALGATFRQQGYLVVPDAVSPEQIEEIKRDAVAICRGRYGDIPGMSPAEPGETDDEVIARYLCIHHPHKKSETLRRYISLPAIVDVLTEVIGPNVKCMQSMLFIKASGKPGQAWHQDEYFIATRDRSLTGAWIALDRATTENGCLRVIPGSHRRGVLWPTEMTEDDRFDCTDESVGFPYTEADEVPVEVEAGSVVFFNGYLLHRSLPNTAASGYRRSLVNHYMSAESLLPNGQEFSFERADNRDIVMVAGTDPYAFKGLETKVKTQVRPERMGGCVWVDDDDETLSGRRS